MTRLEIYRLVPATVARKAERRRVVCKVYFNKDANTSFYSSTREALKKLFKATTLGSFSVRKVNKKEFVDAYDVYIAGTEEKIAEVVWIHVDD